MATQTDPSNRAAPGISRFLVQVYGDDRQALLDYAVEEGHGIDVSDFMSQHLLDDATRCAHIVNWYRERLPDVPGDVTLHSALWDLMPSARDSKVRAATKERISQCLDIAEEIGIPSVVCHLDFFPLARDPSYARKWTERQGLFWRELLQGRSVILLLENMWEPRPDIVRTAVESVGLESVGACLDAPHVHLNSLHSQSEWVEGLGTHIRCLHVSDNDRSLSQHLPAGQGTIDWKDLLSALVRQGLSVPAVMEVHGIAGARATVGYLRELDVGDG
ncbi:MAG TPA: TIM barrel protein [Armatimonadota bacterium]|nr:TIM barrel protein [Armatimonadota bacterium]